MKKIKRVVFILEDITCRRQQVISVCTEPEGISLDVIRKGISENVSAEKSPTRCVPSAHICVFSRNS